MSRQIDLSEPLSDEDREWLMNNNREADVRANDAAHSRGAEDLGPLRTGQGTDVTGKEPSLGSDRMYPTGLTPGGADLDVERRAAQFRAALEPEDAPENSDQDSVDPTGQRGLMVESDDRPYESWDKADLQAEAGKRELAKSGNKAELAERLRSDDVERAEMDTESADEPDAPDDNE